MATSWRGRLQGALLTSACVVTFLWALASMMAAGVGLHFADSVILQLLEWLRQIVWIYFLVRLLKGDAAFNSPYIRTVQTAAAAFSALLLLLFLAPFLSAQQVLNFRFISHLILAFLGLVLLEQMYRNLRQDRVWGMKFMALGIGATFAYEFYMYADALLLRRIDTSVWDARGMINAMIMPMLAITAARNPSWSLDMFVSRGVVFHSAAIAGASMYLLAMAAGGYYIRHFGGTWGGAMQVTFLFGALLLLLSLLSSGQLRAKLHVFISKHFFNYKYDYREEWKRFIETLDRPGAGAEQLREQALAAVAAILQCPQAIYLERDAEAFRTRIRWNISRNEQPQIPCEDPLLHFIEERRWIVDLNELRRFPGRYDGTPAPKILVQSPWAWLIIPLFSDRLFGLIVLAPSHAQRDINWEDRDLLRIAAFQAANYLRLLDASEKLAQAKQFEAFHQLSAFVMHDLKNIAAQLSLVATNAKKHKANPAFIEDAVGTLEHSVKRMSKLLAQLQSGVPRASDKRIIDLVSLLQTVVREKQSVSPAPQLETRIRELSVLADEQRLISVFSHLIQNAQDATGADGTVCVRLMREKDRALIYIEDTGTGMDSDFIKHRLFRPFDTTKGLTGMGIGAFEAKMYVLELGGDLHVTSVPGKGTCFRVILPCIA